MYAKENKTASYFKIVYYICQKLRYRDLLQKLKLLLQFTNSLKHDNI